MDGPAGLDWRSYLSGLSTRQTRALAAWLAERELGVGEFMELVDCLYAVTPARWRNWPRAFVARVGLPAAEAYASRKRRFARLVATLEEALASGARSSIWPSTSGATAVLSGDTTAPTPPKTVRP